MESFSFDLGKRKRLLKLIYSKDRKIEKVAVREIDLVQYFSKLAN